MLTPPLTSTASLESGALRRIGVISDVHADDEALLAAVEFLDAQNVDLILCPGDIVDGPGDADYCCRLLRKRGIPTVRGNHDRWLLEDQMRQGLPYVTPPGSLSDESIRWLRHLPRTQIYDTMRGKLLLCHGLGHNDMAAVSPGDSGYALEANIPLQELIQARKYRFVLGGHTHEPLLRTINRLTILNPGALMREYGGLFATIDFSAGEMQWYELNSSLEVGKAESGKW